MTKPKSWRDTIKIHPACAAIPEASEDEKRGMLDDIRAHGLRHSVVIIEQDVDYELLDGRTRLDVIERMTGKPVRLDFKSGDPTIVSPSGAVGRSRSSVPTSLTPTTTSGPPTFTAAT